MEFFAKLYQTNESALLYPLSNLRRLWGRFAFGKTGSVGIPFLQNWYFLISKTVRMKDKTPLLPCVTSFCLFCLCKHLWSVPGPLIAHPMSGTATWASFWVQTPSKKKRSNLFSPSNGVKPRFHSRIEPLQKLVHVCEVCLVLLLPAPWKEAGAGLGAARACGSSGSAPGCSPGPSTGRGPHSPLPRTKMRKSNFNPQHKAYKINCSAPPQIICRVLNGILLTGNASIQEKGSKVRL